MAWDQLYIIETIRRAALARHFARFCEDNQQPKRQKLGKRCMEHKSNDLKTDEGTVWASIYGYVAVYMHEICKS